VSQQHSTNRFPLITNSNGRDDVLGPQQSARSTHTAAAPWRAIVSRFSPTQSRTNTRSHSGRDGTQGTGWLLVDLRGGRPYRESMTWISDYTVGRQGLLRVWLWWEATAPREAGMARLPHPSCGGPVAEDRPGKDSPPPRHANRTPSHHLFFGPSASCLFKAGCSCGR
jgi:hypothetical protein